MALYLRYAVRSDQGLVRHNNEDSVYAGPRLLAIADGMGGHAAGEVASKIVIGTLEILDEDRPLDDLIGSLHDTVLDANNRIADAVRARKELEGMGTTLTALRFSGSQVGLVHVGDSRAYLMRNGQLSQITHDDTYVQYLVDSGKITADEAKDHPRKSVILRALLGSDVEPDVSIREARAGDRYLLCSDGLSDVVSPETIAEALQLPEPQAAADRLVELALRGGGPDNVTVIVADVVNARIGDRIDDVPIVAGAFVDPAAADVPPTTPTSAAQRAKALTPRPQPTDVESAPAERKGHRWRPWAAVIGIVVLIVAALSGTYAWAQTKYFVWRADGDVAIYQGVNAEFGPVKFFNVDRVTDLRLDDLQDAFRSRVVQGITANSRTDAEQIVRNLKGNVKPPCPVALPSSSVSPTSTPTPTPTPTPSSSTPHTSPRASGHAPSRAGNRSGTATRRRTSGHAVGSGTRITARRGSTGTRSAAVASTGATAPTTPTPLPTTPTPLPATSATPTAPSSSSGPSSSASPSNCRRR